MGRNKAKNRDPERAQQRLIKKMKTNTFKGKGVKTRSRKSGEQYKKTCGNPGLMEKHAKSNPQRILEQTNGNVNKTRQRRITRQLSASMKNSSNVNDNGQSPNGINFTGQTKQQNNNRISTADTILIEDSDEETESNGENSRPLFYLDRNPGVRDAEVPLYNVCHEIDKPATTVTNQPRPDESVIVLDSTIDQTMNDSLKEMQINVETIQPSSSDTESNSSSKIISNVPIDKQSNRSAATVRNVSPDVIELSDYSDTEPSISYLSKNTTPAFPAMDCIPLGYDVLKPQTSKSAVVQKPQKKSKWNNADNKNTKASPLSEAANLAEKQEVTKRMVIIDGNNVAYGHLNGKMFSVKGLQLCINYFKKLGYEVTAVVPQFRLKRHHSTDYVLLEKMLRGGDITLAPCKNLPGQYSSTYDDRLILSVAEQFDGVIISNDNFRDLLEISPAWRRIIETRVIGYTWVKDCFFLPDDPYGRHGPTLQQILNGKSE